MAKKKEEITQKLKAGSSKLEDKLKGQETTSAGVSKVVKTSNSKLPTSSSKPAKAGKRSKKAIEEATQKQTKAAQKALSKTTADKKVVSKPKPRQLKLSKNQKAARELIEKDKLYTIAEAIALLPKVSKVKFDATAEAHIVLEVDPKQSDQLLRTSAILPAGSGKKTIVAVIADESQTAAAKKAGADRVDSEKLIAEIQKGKTNFDVLIATPESMAQLAKLAKVLGPKGLMPSPKSGTVTTKVAEAVGEIKKGKVELKNDPSGIVHVAFGKLSFKAKDLETNLQAIMAALRTNKPSGVKGRFIKSLYVSSTMSPSIKINLEKISSKQ